MQRIINVKPQLARAKQLACDFKNSHLKNKKILTNKKNAILLEDLLEIKKKFRDGSHQPYSLPYINNRASTSAATKNKGSQLTQFTNNQMSIR